MKKKLLILPVLALSSVMLGGCVGIKPYDKPEFVEIEPNQTAFVIPLEEDAAVFLYQYSGKTLESVMDSEVRNKIGSVLLEQYSKLKILNRSVNTVAIKTNMNLMIFSLSHLMDLKLV